MVRGKVVVDAKINGAPVRLIIDTGATIGGLTPEAARQFGIKTHHLDTDGPVRSVAGEIVEFEAGTVQALELAGSTLHDFEVIVGGRVPNIGVVGRLGENLLGAGDAEFDLAQHAVRLFHPDNCSGGALAYWNPAAKSELALEDGPSTRQLIGRVEINGHPVRAMFDTGAPVSYLTRAAADRLGLVVEDSNHEPGIRGVTGDGRILSVATANAGTFKIGATETHNVKIHVADLRSGEVDMLIGLDFFMAHRVIVDRQHNVLVFSENSSPSAEP
jgi:predicted aspartyl protease